MDYVAEIAGSPDVEEALDRLRQHEEFPIHMVRDTRVAGLRDSYPDVWRSELSNWLYAHPRFAAVLWSELRYGHTYRERVAREAVRIALEQGLIFGHRIEQVIPVFGRMTFEDLAKRARHLELLRPVFVRKLISFYSPNVDLQQPVHAVREIAAATKPQTSYLQPREPARDYLDRLSEAVDVPYDPPAFLQRLIELMDMEDPLASEQIPAAVRDSKDSLLKLRKNARTAPQELDEFVYGLIENRELTESIARAYGVPVAFAMVHEHELNDTETLRRQSGRAAEYAGASPKPPGPECATG